MKNAIQTLANEIANTFPLLTVTLFVVALAFTLAMIGAWLRRKITS